MNPFTRLYRASRVFRIVLYLLMVPATLFVWFLADNSFENYTEVGNLTILAAFLFFALWAWWYGEDRDRRRAAKSSHNGLASAQDGDGQ